MHRLPSSPTHWEAIDTRGNPNPTPIFGVSALTHQLALYSGRVRIQRCRRSRPSLVRSLRWIAAAIPIPCRSSACQHSPLS